MRACNAFAIVIVALAPWAVGSATAGNDAGPGSQRGVATRTASVPGEQNGVAPRTAPSAQPGEVAPRVQSLPRERRIALVIGNASYRYAPLKNPVNDARAVGSALKELGFEVSQRENLGMRPMIETLRDFSVRSAKYDVRVFYYAGHGIQVMGRNYLLPVDAEVLSEEDIPKKSVDATELVERLGQLSTGNNVVILDACRSNPFKDLVVVGPDGRTVQAVKFRGQTPSGLAEMNAPPGMVVAFSAKAGQIALDGSGSPNSLYTRHLLAHIGTPGLPVEQMFRRVRTGVWNETKGMQRPFEDISLFSDLCFRAGPGGQCGFEPARSMANSVQPVSGTQPANGSLPR